MERSVRESPPPKTRHPNRNEPFRNQTSDNIPLWQSTRQGRLSNSGKRSNDWDFLSERENVPQNDSTVEGLPLKKSNMAASSTPSPKQQDASEQDHINQDEDEEDDTGISTDEKRDIFNSVSTGDIDLLEDMLDTSGADINITWFGDNLLIAALRAEQESMAEFLIDNGVDYNYKTKVFEVGEVVEKSRSVYEVSCRQMAYDKDLPNIVEIIDSKNGELFPFVKPRERQTRSRRPAKVDSPESVSTDLADDEASVTSLPIGTRKAKPLLGRQSSENESIRDNDTDSGHHSDISRREDVADSPDTSFEHGREDYRQRKPDPNDEGYCSISPHSSRRGTPTNSADSYKRGNVIKLTKSAIGIKREMSKTSDAKQKDNGSPSTSRKIVNAPGSYNRESRMWSPKGKMAPSKEAMLAVVGDDSPPALVRTQSPWQDDKLSNSRRQRRLPVTPSYNTQVHKPRIMSPPSQSGHRVTKILSDTKIVTLPNKMSFPSLRNSLQATRIEVPGENMSDTSSRPSIRTQLKYGQSASHVDQKHMRKYDEGFVINSEMGKRKKSTYRS